MFDNRSVSDLRCSYLEIGTIQGSPGNPDYSALPRARYMEDDCIHLTADGYLAWGAELAMVIDRSARVNYTLDLSPDAPLPELDDPFGEEVPPSESAGLPLIVFEAENYTELDSGGWSVGRTAGVWGIEAAGPDTGGADANARVTYEIPVETAGVYSLWIRRFALNESQSFDQVRWGVDGQLYSGDGSGAEFGNSYIWVKVGDGYLDEGTRQLYIERRDPYARIDRIALVDPGETIVGDGPPSDLVPRPSSDPDQDRLASLTIDYQSLRVADTTGEKGIGKYKGDEPRLVVIEFRATPGPDGSVEVTNTFRYDGPTGRDRGDVWTIPDRIGRFDYSDIKLTSVEDIRAGALPEIVGHVALLLEDDSGSSAPVREKVDDATDVLRSEMEDILGNLTPIEVAMDPQGLTEDIIEAARRVVEATEAYDNQGVSDWLESNLRDIGGADVVGYFPTIYLAVGESLVDPVDQAFAEQMAGVNAAGGALRDRTFQIDQRGSGANYVVDVEVTVG